MQFIIPDTRDGCMLRTYLQADLGLSRRLITRLKQTKDGILLGGLPVTVRAVVRGGDVLTLSIEDTGTQMTNACAIARGVMPPIVYQDDDLLICNKPGHMPTHPSHGHLDDTLANAVCAYLAEQNRTPATFRPINRLDRETSGVVLIARHQLAASRLSCAMRQRHIKKAYLAILDGIPPLLVGTVNAPIRRAQQSIILREICQPDAPDAQAAQTDYRVLTTWVTHDGQPRALVYACPHTGRTHQLRLHFASLGTPIAGDTLYGCVDTLSMQDRPPRQCLHAYSLSFAHPTTQEYITVRAPLADDLLAYLPDHARAALPELLSTVALPCNE